MKRFIVLNIDNVVVCERFGTSIVEGEIESDNGKLGQVKQDDGTFTTPEISIDPQPYEPTNSEIAQMISDLQADLIIAGVI